MFNNSNITLFNRKYVQQADGFARISMGEITVTVHDDPFWQKFAQRWEPETERIYQSCVRPGSTVLDIGAWIGPTLLFALACGAKTIYAIEPNPGSYQYLKSLLELNPNIADGITLINKAVSAQTGILNMGLPKDEEDTSMFGIQARSSPSQNLQIPATTLGRLIQDYDLNAIDLIKIDIEGTEVLLYEDLQALSHGQQPLIHLSVHVPFFPENADKHAFTHSLKNFTVFDDRGEPLSHEELVNRITTESLYPEWGTKHGNFFELVLVTKPEFLATRGD